jgi:hypothetical protein
LLLLKFRRVVPEEERAAGLAPGSSITQSRT